MQSEIIIRGQVLSQKESTYEGKTSRSIQLLTRNGKGVADVINVKLHEGADAQKYKEGASVELLVDVSAFEGSVYFKAVRDLRAETRPTAPAKAS